MNSWQRRFVAAPPRLQEAVEIYQALGLEVRLDPVHSDELPPQCHDCQAALSLFRVIYTREALP